MITKQTPLLSCNVPEINKQQLLSRHMRPASPHLFLFFKKNIFFRLLPSANRNSWRMRGNRGERERDGPGFEFMQATMVPHLLLLSFMVMTSMSRLFLVPSFQALPCLVQKCARHKMYLNVAACESSEYHWRWLTPRFHRPRLCYRARAKLFCSVLHATSCPTGSVSEVGRHACLMTVTFLFLISSWFLCLWLQSASVKSMLRATSGMLLKPAVLSRMAAIISSDHSTAESHRGYLPGTMSSRSFTALVKDLPAVTEMMLGTD